MTAERARAASAGIVLFVVLTFLGSWFVAASLRVFDLNVLPGPLGTRLFTTSLLYAVSMGWQPLLATWVVRRWVDPPDSLDMGLRPGRGVFSVVGALAAIGFAALASGAAWATTAVGIVGPSFPRAEVEPIFAGGPTTPSGLVVLLLASAGTLACIWLQAFTEEIGWRGYFLPRSMQRFGRWQGLLLHGAVWGIWYAPVLFFSSYREAAPLESILHSLGFVVSCMLIGTLLGWLRLASNSLTPPVVANTILTLVAGLPYFVHGLDAGIRSAVFGPLGWLVLAAGIASLMASRWRDVVRVPPAAVLPSAPYTFLVRIWIAFDRPRDRPWDRSRLN